MTCVLTPVAYVAMFSGFNAYDDEGSFLVTLHDYLSGQSLYTQVFSIYGPLYYEVMGGLFRLLGVAPSHDIGRLVTLVVWLLGSLVGGLGAFRLTRNLWLGIGAQLVMFHVLASLVSEPMHPSGLASLLLVCLVLVAAFRSARPSATAVLIGATVGGLLMIKINDGAFAAIAVAFAFAASLPARWRRQLLPPVVAVVVLLPVGLMTGQLGRDWVLDFALVAAFSGAAVCVACAVSPARVLPPASLGRLIAGGLVVLLATLAVAFAGGTRPADLFNGLVGVALRLPQLYVWPVRIGPVNVIWAALSLAVALATFALRVYPAPRPATAAGLRIGAGLLTWVSVLLLPSSLFLLALPLAWIATQPPSADAADPIDPYARVLLPALAVLESLQAYPVAGTQLSLAALMLVPVGAITLSDGIRQLRQAQAAPAPARAAAWAAPGALIVNVAALWLFGFLAVSDYSSGAPLALPGAQSVRVPAQRGADLRALVAAVDQKCSTFITYPGMTSFYLWTGQSPPVPLYAGVWMFVLDGSAQQSDVDQLHGRPRLCVVKNQSVIDFWSEGRPVPDRPLVNFIDTSFVSAGSFGDYELLIKK